MTLEIPRLLALVWRHTAHRRDALLASALQEMAPPGVTAVLGPLGPEDAVLVKASRRAGLEDLAEALLA